MRAQAGDLKRGRMNELEREYAGTQAELVGILEQLESALADIDRLQLMVIGAQLSQVIEDVRALMEA
jgi:hypothetical protein